MPSFKIHTFGFGVVIFKQIVDQLKVRGIATLGSSRHVPTHNFHKILRKICIKWNVYIFLFFFKNRKWNSYSVRLSSYTAIINAIHTELFDQFIALKNKKKWILSEANQNKIVFSCRILQISIVWSFTNINSVRSMGFINYLV